MFSLEYRLYTLTFKRPLKTAHGALMTREGLILRLENESGLIGYGDVAPIPRFGSESLGESIAALSTFAGAYDPSELDALPASLPCTRCALQMAESFMGMPLDSGASLPSAYLLSGAGSLLDEAEYAISEGYTVLKWKIGADLNRELSLFDSLAALAKSQNTSLRLDAGGALTASSLDAWRSALVDAPVDFLEQPLPVGMESEIIKLSEDFPCKIALDESVNSSASMERLDALGFVGLYVVKPLLLEDLGSFCRFCEKSQTPRVYSSVFETNVGRAFALKLASEDPCNYLPLGFGVKHLFEPHPLLVDTPNEILWNSLHLAAI